MNHREQTSEEERVTTLALEVQQHCHDYFDGKLTPQEWVTLVVDAMQQHQAENRRLANLAEQERMAQEWREKQAAEVQP